MAQQRATLALHDFANLHVDLPAPRAGASAVASSDRSSPQSRTPSRRSTHSTSIEDVFPELVKPKLDPLVGLSVRIPLSQFEGLKRLKREQGVDQSEFVRLLISAGLKKVGIDPVQ